MDEEAGGINVVPLVDVMLVLLTIVLTTATFISSGHIPLDLAKATHAAPARTVPAVLSQTLDGRVYLNDRALAGTPEALAAALAAFPRATPVVVRADARLALGEFVALADRVKGFGFADVSLEVRRP